MNQVSMVKIPLCDKATEVYQMYLDGKIANKQYADEVVRRIQMK